MVGMTLGKYIESRIIAYRLYQHVTFGPVGRLTIADSARVGNALFNTVSGHITIEENVFFGHNVCVLTGTHDIKTFGKERQHSTPTSGRDICICSGVWVASNATILGPCVIGDNSVVAAGATVISNVEPFTVVGGVPAKVIGRVNNNLTLIS